VRVHLWPQSFSVARLRRPPALDVSRLEPSGPPVALLVGHDEVSLIAPAELVAEYAPLVEKESAGWRALTLDCVLPFSTVGLLAAATRVLADVDVPVVVFSSFDTDHILVPSAKLGRALAALHQVNLGRFLEGKAGERQEGRG